MEAPFGLLGRAAGARVRAVELSSDMQRVVLEQSLGFVATVTRDGRPNLSPKGTTTVWDQHRLMFADIASPGTVENLASNPNVEINVVDPIVRKGYRFKGHATTHTSGVMFDRGLAILRARGFTTRPERVRSIVVIEITGAAPLVSPAYDDGATEETVSEHWLRHHTELHRSPR
jgi:predicted pyridoxine 5'-phosphate oxidase superfamily flavin-nucleotide-binding protein